MSCRWTARALVAGAVALLAGCATEKPKIDDSRLAGIPPDQMEPVRRANAEIDRVQQDRLAAEQAKVEADGRVKLAKSERDVAQAQFDQVKTQFDIQQKNQQAQAAAPYQAPVQGQPGQPAYQPPSPGGPTTLVTPAAFQEARLTLEQAKAKVAYLEKLDDIAGTQVKLDDRRLNLAKARLEQARYRVLAAANPAEVEAMGISAPDFDAEVAKQQADVATVKADLARQRAEARARYQQWAGLENQLSQFPNANIRRAEVPPPPRG